MKYLVFLFLLFFASTPVTRATHIVGGELSYRYLGLSDYEVTLTVYRDCANGLVPYDSIAFIGVFNSGNLLIDSLKIPFTTSKQLDNVLPNPCLQPNDIVCYEVSTYKDTINLPQISGGYQLAYQVCCRNRTISNIFRPLATGSVYACSIPELPDNLTNSSPVFNTLPTTYVCDNFPFTLDYSATDPDGDSLVYELFHPYTLSLPDAFDFPPFSRVTWLAPFSFSNMLGSSTPIAVDSATGILTGEADITGQFVIGVKVSEYRDGIFLGESFRDYQLNVLNCTDITISSLLVPNFSCEEFTANFSNNSAGAISGFLWDFGDPNSNNDTSSAFEPSYTYPDLGTYQVSLISFSSIESRCNDTSYGEVVIKPKYTHDVFFSYDSCSRDVTFGATSPIDSLTEIKYRWDFGDGSGISFLPTPTHQYETFGTYTAELTSFSVENQGCALTTDTTFTLSPNFKLNSTYTINPCTPFIEFSATTNLDDVLPISYQWNFGDGSFSKEANPTYQYRENGLYTISVQANTIDSVCFDSLSFLYTEKDRILPYVPNVFTPNNDGINDFLKAQGDIEQMNLKIYNRWGRLVFESNDQNHVWDGRYNDEPSEPGVYFYRFLTECPGEKNNFQSGTITLIR